jgi:hypothetical protein
MKHLLLALTILLLSACDPCNCEDCCGNTIFFTFDNRTGFDLETVWYGPIDSEAFADTLFIPAAESATLFGGGGLLLIDNISQRPWRDNGVFTYDSLHIRSGGQIINRFNQTDCNRNSLCESAYSDESERGDRRGDRLRFRYEFQ